MYKILFISLLMLVSQLSTAQEWVTDDSLESTVMLEDNQLKVLYFTASWCGPCRYMKPVIADLASDNKVDARFYKLDIDKNVTNNILGVRSVPTFFYIKNGRLLGRSVGARSGKEMRKLIEKHDAMKVTGEKLAYRGKKSKYQLVAGAHQKLTVDNLKKIWENPTQLNQLAQNIHDKLTDPKDIECAIILSKRAIELDNNTNYQLTYARLLHKSGDTKKAIKTVKKARKTAKRNRQSTTAMDQFIAEIKNI